MHSRYSDILDQFRSRYKDLETASIDSVVADVKYHDEFQLVDSKSKSSRRVGPGASAVATDKSGKEWSNPFEWLSSFPVKSIKTRWDRAIAGTGICPICHRAEKPWHMPANCPLLKDLNLKLVNGPPASTAPKPAGTPTPAPTAASPTPGGRVAFTDASAPVGGAPSGLTAAVEEDDYSSDEDLFRWTGDDDGVDFGVTLVAPSKSNPSVSLYPSCYHVSVTPPPTGLPSLQPLPSSSSSCLVLPDRLQSIIRRLATSSISPDSTSRDKAVADTGATDHMFPDKSAFISYKRISNLQVRMGNNSYLPVLGRGTVIISLNGQRILVRHALHVPGLAIPLYSLRAHLNQPGCGFVGTSFSGLLVYFPSFVLSVDTSSDCHLSYEPLGSGASLDSLHYVQRRCSPSLYPSELNASRNATICTLTPDILPDDGSSDGDPDATVNVPSVGEPSSLAPPVVIPADISPPLPSSLSDSNNPSFDFMSVSAHLRSLADAVQDLSHPVSRADLAVSPAPTTSLLSALPNDKIMAHFHHPGSTLPAVRPCDTANASDTKTHWSGEEIHRIMGCRKFRNYKHILHVSRDGEYIDGGEFPPSLGSFATIPKAKRGKLLDRSRYRFLDAVHIDIAFGDCLSVGGFRYALILVDRATRYNWTFGLKSLSAACILAALRLFRAAAGSLAHCFYCDCDAKLFGSAISEYLIDNGSKIFSAPAKRQSTNGLVESHWKVMVHMARAYLTEKQMPRSYWFFAITHAARMMNAIPGKVDGGLASPFLLVHGVGHDERTWIPLFSLCYFHHTKDGDQSRSKHQAHTMDGIIVGRSPTSNALLVYNPRTKQYYEPDSYRIDSYRLPALVYPAIRYDGGLFCSLHRDDNPSFEEKYPPGTHVERVDPSTNQLLAGTVMDIPFPTDVSDPNADIFYTVLFDNGTSASVPLSDMSSLVPAPPVDIATDNSQDSLLPPFLRLNSKITYEHDGRYHKGYLGKHDGIFRFVFKSHVNKRKEDWGVDLPHLPVTWVRYVRQWHSHPWPCLSHFSSHSILFSAIYR